jgi:hypothetical protein
LIQITFPLIFQLPQPIMSINLWYSKGLFTGRVLMGEEFPVINSFNSFNSHAWIGSLNQNPDRFFRKEFTKIPQRLITGVKTERFGLS